VLSRVEVAVVDEHGKPLTPNHATLLPAEASLHSWSDPPASVAIRADRVVLTAVPPGEWDFAARADGGVALLRFRAPSPGGELEFTATIERTGGIRGRLLGAGAAGVTVYCSLGGEDPSDASGSQRRGVSRARADGGFELRDVKPGSGKLVAIGPAGFGRAAVGVEAGSIREVTLALEATHPLRLAVHGTKPGHSYLVEVATLDDAFHPLFSTLSAATNPTEVAVAAPLGLRRFRVVEVHWTPAADGRTSRVVAEADFMSRPGPESKFELHLSP
jgi:hypothetical protein